MLSTSHLAVGTTLFLSLTSAFVATRPSEPAVTAPIAAPQESDDEYVEPTFRIEYFRTDRVSAYELQEVVSGILGQGWPVSSAISGLEDYPAVLQAVGDASIVVACTEEAMPGVLALLERLEEELRASTVPAPEPLVTRQFRLQHVSRDTIESALRPYRMVTASPMAMYPDGTTAEMPSITILDGNSLVIVRDTEARIAEIGSLLESVDRPAPQVRMTYMLLRGYDERSLAAEGLNASDLDQNLPKDLVQDLGSLVPVVGFRRMSFGVVQGNALAPKVFSDRFAFAEGSIQLELRPVNFDEVTGALNIERIDFDCVFQGDGSSQSFETGARLVPDEYMVLGGIGNVPVFLVLRMTRL